jgi:4-diphosphocytidyl-2-C-methyl-D-erythritol kinase
MIVFPNTKINLGLSVTARRQDGYHDIETVFYPVQWCDALEVIPAGTDEPPFVLTQSGISVTGPEENNLVHRAWRMVTGHRKLPAIKVHLHKTVPMGAGLGGGSADAAAFINLVNTKFDLELSLTEKMKIAESIGSDCAFFIRNEPVLATGKGDLFSKVTVDLSPYYILIVHPGIHSGTAEAYACIVPVPARQDLRMIMEMPVEEWRHHLINDFETVIFKKHPEVQVLKETLYHKGALYAGMSGSGSAVFGIFSKEPDIPAGKGHNSFLQKPVAGFCQS